MTGSGLVGGRENDHAPMRIEWFLRIVTGHHLCSSKFSIGTPKFPKGTKSDMICYLSYYIEPPS